MWGTATGAGTNSDNSAIPRAVAPNSGNAAFNPPHGMASELEEEEDFAPAASCAFFAQQEWSEVGVPRTAAQ